MPFSTYNPVRTIVCREIPTFFINNSAIPAAQVPLQSDLLLTENVITRQSAYLKYHIICLSIHNLTYLTHHLLSIFVTILQFNQMINTPLFTRVINQCINLYAIISRL